MDWQKFVPAFMAATRFTYQIEECITVMCVVCVCCSNGYLVISVENKVYTQRTRIQNQRNNRKTNEKMGEGRPAYVRRRRTNEWSARSCGICRWVFEYGFGKTRWAMGIRNPTKPSPTSVLWENSKVNYLVVCVCLLSAACCR